VLVVEQFEQVVGAPSPFEVAGGVLAGVSAIRGLRSRDVASVELEGPPEVLPCSVNE
jgi:hypothetical protein